MAGTPLKRKRRQDAIAAVKAGGVVARPRGMDKRLDPAWVEAAWQVYLNEPTETALAERMQCTAPTAHALVVEGAPSSLPFLVRLRGVLEAAAKKKAPEEVDTLIKALEGLGALTVATTEASNAMARVALRAKKKAVAVAEADPDGPEADLADLDVMHSVDPQRAKGYADTLGKAAEVVRNITGDAPPPENADPKVIVAKAFAGLMGGLQARARELMGPLPMDAVRKPAELPPASDGAGAGAAKPEVETPADPFDEPAKP